MIELVRRLRATVPNLTIGVLIGLTAGGGAFALAAQTSHAPEDAGVHGGPNPRFHDAGDCDLVDLGPLDEKGNWTHGDYVSAVAKEDPSKIRDAAHSRCGKPDHGAAGARGRSKAAEEKARTERSKEPKEKPSPKPGKTADEPLDPSSPEPSPAEPAPEPSPDASTPEPLPEASTPESSVDPEATGSPDGEGATP